MTISNTARRLPRLIAARAATALSSGLIASALIAGPALAQDAGATPATPPPPSPVTGPNQPGEVLSAQQTAQERGGNQEIVVTGTLFRRTDKETASPVTVLTADTIAKAGLTNTADAIRSISADSSGSIPSAFTAGFGSGSAAVSLRGLTVNSTLVLINGVRTANYPYADDGQRSFVDLNSIPQSTIDRIEVLKDGASASYGADAIGGVVNIITKKQITGIEGTVEGGISSRHDGGEQRATLTAGYGDLATQGFNFYVNGEYEHDTLIHTTARGFPYDTADLSSIGGDNNNYESPALQGFGGRFGTASAVVRPATQGTPGNIFSGVALPGGLTQILNPAGCAAGTIQHSDESGAYCEQNVSTFTDIQPEQERYGLTGHATLQVSDDIQAYAEATWYHSKVFSDGLPQTIRQRNPLNTTNIVLPALLANGQLNPNDPYASQGLAAQISYGFSDIPNSATTRDNVYRAASGISGKFGDDWNFAVDATYAKSSLKGESAGLLNIAGLTSAIVNGTYNFVDPSLNTQAIRDTISPVATTTAKSEIYLLQGNIGKELFQLPGGSFKVAVGGQVRHEMLNNPNANADQAFLNLNAVSAAGKHWVEAAYFEIDAPVLKVLDLGAAGRYDHYSEGYGHLSPKFTAKFTPIRQVAFRGTFSKGFRAPTFAEIQQGAVVGYTSATPPCSVKLQHGATGTADTCTGGDAYVQSYSIGYNSASNPNIKPELSRSFTGGIVAQPVRWLSLTADYYNIKKTRVISGGPLSGTAISNYYNGDPLPEGYTVDVDDADPAYPNGIRKILIVNSPYANASALKTSGLDFEATATFKLSPTVTWQSSAEATEILKYNFKPSADSPYDHYVGTQAPYVLSSGAGTPRWRANWQNSVTAGPATLSATAYYTSGYKAVAEDQVGHGATTCADNLYDGSLPDFYCRTKHFVDVDLVGSLKVNQGITLYFNVVNLFDVKAPLNPSNYAAVNYNPTWSQQGAVGRFLRAGAHVKF